MQSPPDDTTTVSYLELENFRRFERLRCHLESDLTVLVAENGGGKTAVLDGLAVGLRPVVEEVRGVAVRGFSPTDVRLVRSSSGAMVDVPDTSVIVEALLGGKRFAWQRKLPSRRSKTASIGIGPKAWAKAVRKDLASAAESDTVPPTLPVIAYYGTGRLWRTHKDTDRKSKAARDVALQTNAYIDALSSSSSYHQFEVWFEKVVREAQNEVMTGKLSPHRPVLSKSAVVAAVNTILGPTGWHGLDWDFLSNEVVATHEVHGRLAVGLLSDGIRNLLALVADLAHRAVRLNPHLGDGACQLATGVVLIDEVDMHLHPSWQQQVLPLLRQAFPRVQFVVTTHSPIVLSTVPSRCIRILGEGDRVQTPTSQTEGYTSTWALSSVFGVDADPPGKMASLLRDMYRRIEDGRASDDDAGLVRAELLKHFGPEHPAMISLRSFERLTAVKQARRG